MGLMFALPSLTVWDTSNGNGWSNSSGGANNGLNPTQTDDVVFDANSGSGRTITLTTATCRDISTSSSAIMVFAGDLNPYGTTIDLSKVSSLGTLQLQGANGKDLTTQNCTIATLLGSANASLILHTDLVVTAQGSSIFISNFNANGFNFTTSGWAQGSSSTLTMGSGTFALTGTGAVWNPQSGCTIAPGTSTIKLTNNSASSKTFSGSNTYNNFWNATSGGGAVNINGNNTFNDLKISAGATQLLPTSIATTVATLTADGTGLPINLQSNASGGAATLTKSGGGTVNVDYCNIKDITALPAATFRARNSVDQGNNTNWTFVPANSKFMTFF